MSIITTRNGRPNRSIGNLGLIAASIAVFIVSSTPVYAFTCEDVRGLSAAEQAYWSKRLNLTSAERQQIWRTCYTVQFRNRRAIPAVSSVATASE